MIEESKHDHTKVVLGEPADGIQDVVIYRPFDTKADTDYKDEGVTYLCRGVVSYTVDGPDTAPGLCHITVQFMSGSNESFYGYLMNVVQNE